MQGKMTLSFDGLTFGLYTANYENTRQVLYATISRYFYHAVVGPDGIGVDGSNNVYDEVLTKLRH